MNLNKLSIRELIPHAGRMCLIESVDSWNETEIQCRSHTHQDQNNPLRLNGKLSSLHLLEYGAQTMAIHGGLLNGNAISGFLAALRNVHVYVDSLDSIQHEIIIKAIAQIQSENGVIYEFKVLSEQQLLLKARATIINL